MSIFSYPFFALWAVCAVLYYTIAGNHQWLLLLGMSLVFYGYSVMRVPVILILVSTVTYLGAVWITYARKNKKASEKTVQERDYSIVRGSPSGRACHRLVCASWKLILYIKGHKLFNGYGQR